MYLFLLPWPFLTPQTSMSSANKMYPLAGSFMKPLNNMSLGNAHCLPFMPIESLAVPPGNLNS